MRKNYDENLSDARILDRADKHLPIRLPER